MDATIGSRPSAEVHPLVSGRHSLATRITHWVGSLAMLVLVMSGLGIFNAAPYLDASDKSDPTHRVLSIDGSSDNGSVVGTVTLFGHTITTTHLFGYGDDGTGGEAQRAFPGWLTLPGYYSLADSRRWHLFFAWILVLAGITYYVAAAIRRDLRLVILRPSDIPKLLPMQLYYFRLRKDPPPYGKYNPLQKAAYTFVLFVLSPLVVLTGLALSPGIDAIANPLLWLFGGRQFARTWHFLAMFLFVGFFFTHMVLVFSTGPFNNIRSMITGRYRLGKHEGQGV
jgi:Ni/Fe-hydrogenase b-type cytochrome subunit